MIFYQAKKCSLFHEVQISTVLVNSLAQFTEGIIGPRDIVTPW